MPSYSLSSTVQELLSNRVTFWIHIICIISFFATACSSNNAEVAGHVKSIVFNSEESVTNSDFNKILDTTFRVIPLATNDECLISNIDRLEIVNGKFYIMDHMSQSVYVFNPDGSYAGKIHKHGRGAGVVCIFTIARNIFSAS